MLKNFFVRKSLLFGLVIGFSFLLGAIAVAQTTPQSSSTEASIPADDGYKVGPDDEIMLRVFAEPDLTGAYIVGTNGMMAVPLIGDVFVEGLSLKEIQNKLVTLLKDGYLLDPQITIEIKKYRPFYILGEVKVPGSYSYVSNMSILNAVAVAGGFTYRANKKSVDIKRTRNKSTDVISGEALDSLVLPGDIIIVKERFF